MINNGKMYFFHCLSPVHIGAGQGVGDIDMPIMRERTTEWPYVPGSSVKGVQRRYYKRLEADSEATDIPAGWTNDLFGCSEDNSGQDDSDEIHEGIAGSLVFTDSRLLAFPVASLHGVFAYVTSPMALRRAVQDSNAAGLGMCDPGIQQMEEKFEKNPQAAFICTGSKLVLSGGSQGTDEENRELWLDEFKFQAQSGLDSLEKWADWCAKQLFPDEEMAVDRMNWPKRLAVVSDEAFHYFVTMCCEVTPRIRISQETKVVDKGALWYEEYIPSEAIMFGLVWCDSIYAPGRPMKPSEEMQKLRGNIPLQIGANVSVGKGRVRFLLAAEEAKKQ